MLFVPSVWQISYNAKGVRLLTLQGLSSELQMQKLQKVTLVSSIEFTSTNKQTYPGTYYIFLFNCLEISRKMGIKQISQWAKMEKLLNRSFCSSSDILNFAFLYFSPNVCATNHAYYLGLRNSILYIVIKRFRMCLLYFEF